MRRAWNAQRRRHFGSFGGRSRLATPAALAIIQRQPPLSAIIATTPQCLTDAFPGTGPGTGITGAELDWTLQVYAGETVHIVSGALAATSGGAPGDGGTEAITNDEVITTNMRVSATITAELDVSTPDPPVITNFHGVFARVVSESAPYDDGWLFYRQTGTDAPLGPGGGFFAVFVAIGGTTYQVWASGDLGAADTGGVGDQLSLTVTGADGTTSVTVRCGGVLVHTIDSATIAAAITPDTLADLPLGLHAGLIPYYSVDDASAVAHNDEAALDDFSACPA